jgi:hypothetical protein
MASVFSYYATSRHYSSDLNDQLSQSPLSSHRFYSPHHILDSSLMVKLTSLLIPAIVNPFICNASHPFMEPRRMTPMCP